MLKQVLVVDTDSGVWRDVRRACRFLADVHVCGDFPAARQFLVKDPPDLLVTNLRLRAYNGLQLVHLASLKQVATRSVVYSNYPDIALIEEAQQAGAFFELPQRLVSALPAYLRCSLPERDRRSPRQIDRRQFFRGGRRASDVSPPPVSTVGLSSLHSG